MKLQDYANQTSVLATLSTVVPSGRRDLTWIMRYANICELLLGVVNGYLGSSVHGGTAWELIRMKMWIIKHANRWAPTIGIGEYVKGGTYLIKKSYNVVWILSQETCKRTRTESLFRRSCAQWYVPSSKSCITHAEILETKENVRDSSPIDPWNSAEFSAVFSAVFSMRMSTALGPLSGIVGEGW